MSPAGYALETAAQCLLCGASDASLLFKVNDYGYWSCRGCHLVRLSPRIARTDLGRFYAEINVRYETNPEPLEQQLKNPTFAYRAQRLERFIPGPVRSFLEVGCGDGNFLAVMRDRGWTVSGAEVSETGARHAEAVHRIEVHPISFDALTLPGRYDAIGLYHVFEHVYEPRAVLRALRPHLRDGGALHVQVPNIRSVDGRLGRAAWQLLATPQHVNFFEPAHLSRLLRDEGFEPLSIETYDPFHSPSCIATTARAALRRIVRRARPGRNPRGASGPEDAEEKSNGGSGAVSRKPPEARGWPYRAAAYALDEVFSRGLAVAQARFGWGNVVDVVARVS